METSHFSSAAPIFSVPQIEKEIYSKILLLNSAELKQELAFYIDYLLSKQFVIKEPVTKKIPQFGCAKGKFRMADDFNAPIDDFNEYMPL